MSIFYVAFGLLSCLLFLVGGVIRLHKYRKGTAERLTPSKLRFSLGVPALLSLIFIFGISPELWLMPRPLHHLVVLGLGGIIALTLSKWVWGKIQKSNSFALYEGLAYLLAAAVICYTLTGVK